MRPSKTPKITLTKENRGNRKSSRISLNGAAAQLLDGVDYVDIQSYEDRIEIIPVDELPKTIKKVSRGTVSNTTTIYIGTQPLSWGGIYTPIAEDNRVIIYKNRKR